MPGLFQSTGKGLINPYNTNLAVSLANEPDAWIAEAIAPSLDVDEESGAYPIYDLTTGFQADHGDAGRAIGEPPTELDFAVDWSTFNVKEYARQVFTDDKEMKLTRLRATSETKIRVLVENLMTLREARVAAIATDAANYPAGHAVTLLTPNRWNEANGDPKANIETAILQLQAKGIDPSMCGCCFSPDVWIQGLRTHPTLTALLGDNERQLMTLAKFAEIFGFAEARLGKGLQNTAVKGAASSIGYVWGDSFVIYLKQSTSPMVPGGTRTFMQTFRYQDLEIKEFETMSRKDPDGIVGRGCHYVDEKIVTADGGYLIADCLA